MKLFHRLLALATLCAFATTARADVANPGNSPGNNWVEVSPYAVVERGPHHSVWQQVTVSTNQAWGVDYRTNSYTELATGLHHLVAGQWIDSDDHIQITATGGIASNSQHSVTFSANINNAAAIDLLTPDGFHLQSHVYCLAYADPSTGLGAVLADLQDSIGQLLPSGNQVLYTNALTNLADVRYTHSLAGFEQDIILRQQPPSPTQFGMNPDTTKLQIWTEFIEFPIPNITVSTNDRTGLVNQDLDFGVMKMGAGNAFSIGGGNVPVPVTKRWVTIGGQTFLIEEVPLNLIAPQLQALPQSSSISHPGTNGLYASRAAYPLDHPVLAPRKPARRQTEQMSVAKSAPAGRGFVLDYTTLNTSQTNYTFQSDSTYYVSGADIIYGTTTVEGGSVIKFTNQPTAGLTLQNVVCSTGPYRVAAFTSKDDNTVGAAITGSTGSPSNTNGATYIQIPPTFGTNSHYLYTNTFKYLRLSFAGTGISAAPIPTKVWHCQFVNCGIGFSYADDSSMPFHNVLFSGCATNIESAGNGVAGEHWTVDGGWLDVAGLTVTNSIFTAVTFASGATLTLANSVTNTSAAGFYQTVGAANYYLADNSPFRDYGTTNIDPGLLSDLSQRTTYPPVVLPSGYYFYPLTLFPQAQRDRSGSPDLGWHYDPIDYAIGNVYLTNAAFNVTAGTAIAGFNVTIPNSGTYALTVGEGGQLLCLGSPTNLCHIVNYNTVQEQSNTNWSTPADGLILPNFSTNTPNSVINCRFTDFSVMAQDTAHIYGEVIGNSDPVGLQDCQLHGGLLNGTERMVFLTNCLLERVAATYLWTDGTSPLYMRNCLFWNGSLSFIRGSTATNALIEDTMFDHTTISDRSSTGYSEGNNGYVTNCNRLTQTAASDVILTNSVYLTNYYGNYYIPTNSPLVHVGSVLASTLQLYHYTMWTIQVIEGTNIVSIGYHYVAANTNGMPLDTTGTGVPDYIKDANGNGLVDSGEISWTNAADLGLKVIITRPRNNSTVP